MVTNGGDIDIGLSCARVRESCLLGYLDTSSSPSVSRLAFAGLALCLLRCTRCIIQMLRMSRINTRVLSTAAMTAIVVLVSFRGGFVAEVVGNG